MQKIVRGSGVALVDGYLVKIAPFSGDQRVLIRSTDPTGRDADNPVIVRQSNADSAYTFANSEVATWYGRLGIKLSASQKAAYDTFVTSLKNAGVWSLLDVIVPPSVPQVAAALLNLRQAKFDGSMTQRCATPCSVASLGHADDHHGGSDQLRYSGPFC